MQNDLIRNFAQGCGLRRRELGRLQIRDIIVSESIWIETGRGIGHKVPVLESHKQYVLSAIAGRRQGRARQELVFPDLPDHLDWYSFRRFYAQSTYHWMIEGGCEPKIAENVVLFWLDLAEYPNVGRRLYLFPDGSCTACFHT